MRRSDFLHASSRVLRALEESHIADALERATRSSADTRSVDILVEAYNRFLPKQSELQDNDLKLLEIFDLSHLVDIAFWTSVLSKKPLASKRELTTTLDSIKLLRKSLPRFWNVIADSRLGITLGPDGSIHHQQSAPPSISLLILESDQSRVTVQRLTAVLTAVDTLGQVCSILHDIDAPLVLLSCDSGSTKEIVLAGAKVVISTIYDNIRSSWEKLIYYRETQSEKRLKLIEHTIPLLEEINKKEKKLGAEQAEYLRRSTIRAIHAVLDNGAVTADMHERVLDVTITIPAVKPKLITDDTGSGA